MAVGLSVTMLASCANDGATDDTGDNEAVTEEITETVEQSVENDDEKDEDVEVEESDSDETTEEDADKTADAGTYEATAPGYGGDIKVAVALGDDGKINDIKILEDKETDGVGKVALDKVKDRIIEGQSTNVEAVTGATASSKGLMLATANALKDADVANDFTEEFKDPKDDSQVKETDIIVVGAGGAGLSAGLTAKNDGANVIILEKNGYAGGNTMVSGGGLNVPNTDLQEKNEIDGDSPELFKEDTMKGGDEKNNIELVDVMTKSALDSYEWLRDEIEVNFIQDRVQQFGGHSIPRAAVPEGNSGYSITQPLLEKCLEANIPIYYEHNVTDIEELNDGKFKVKVDILGDESEFIANNSVILATGGFAANVEMREKYNSTYGENYKTTSLSSSTGDGIILGEKLGADLVDMEYIQVYPTCNPNTGIISYVANSRFDGAILVNKEGNRFVNEGGRRDEVSNAILNQTDSVAYLVWSDEIESVGNMTDLHRDEFNKLLDDNLIIKSDNIEDSADDMGIDVDNLLDTIDNWNMIVDTEDDKEFNKTGAYRTIKNGPFYIQKVSPSTHHTMGGLKIDQNAQVLDENNDIVSGVYAAGEVVGGIHGTNRLGGNAITDCIVFGRIAGQNAAAEAK